MFRLLALFILWPTMLLAEDSLTARFDVRFGPLRVAEIVIAMTETDSAYAAAGRVTGAGLAGAFGNIHFDMAAEGRRDGARLLPLIYREDVNTGRRASRVTLAYEDGQPVIVSALPVRAARDWDIDPADQTDTIDPMSALYRLARPRPLAPLCGWSVAVFDGRRRSSLTLDAAEGTGDSVVCEGRYTRRAGFPPEAMAERRVFPFTAEYSRGPDGDWRLTRMVAQTLYGRVRIIGRF